MEIVRALVLAGQNRHDRPWPSLRSGPKALVPVANRPILCHALESLRRASLLEATIAVEHKDEELIRDAVGDGSRWGLTVRFVPWDARTGLGGAFSAARGFVGDEPVLVQPADALHRENMHPLIVEFARERLDAMALKVPGASGSRAVSSGYLFSERAVSMLLDEPGAFADPVAGVRERGGQVRVHQIDGCLPCHGEQDGLLDGNRRLLDDLRSDVDFTAHPSCEFQGAVQVHPTARLEHTLIRGPVIIGPRTHLSHAYVGPYTSIGADVRIEGSQIEYSIVLDRAELLHVGARLESSIIGRHARVDRSFGLPSAMRLAVGDGARVTLT